MESIRINDNITLTYIPMEKLKTTTIGVYIHRPLCGSEASCNALLPYVLKRGCKKAKDSEAIEKYLEGLYGAGFGAGVMKIGEDHVIYLSFETISDKYAADGERLVGDITELALSVLFEPAALTDEVVSQEKKNAEDRILAEINEKIIYASNRCTEEMCAGEPFAQSPFGTIDGIRSINAKSLSEHYEHIITCSPMDIYICGAADIKEIADKIKSFTDGIKFTPSEIPETHLTRGREEVKRVTDHMDVTQGKLCMGFETGINGTDDDYAALMVANSIFGGGAHSKLFNNVREKLSLCYYASSSLVKTKGIMYVNAGIEFKNFEKAYDEILMQLENVKKGDISELEYTSSIGAIINQLESNKDDQRLMQLYYLAQKISGTNMAIDEMKKKIQAVTLDDVKRAAENIKLNTVYFLAGKEE